MGGFETHPYENHSGANHISGTAAPQCGKPEIGSVPLTETVPVTVGFPGTAAPQCGICSGKTEDS
ncbi:MAG: hypothetical protein NTV33_06705 [Coprothermobacterota bacterium]|nr:hypothetical protein [Coprothermobacterota bacterium]